MVFSMETEEDTYQDGEIGGGITSDSRSNFGTYKSVDDAVKAVSGHYGLPFKNFFIFNGEN